MARQRKQTELSESDWNALFPGTDYTIGTTVIQIEPLSLESIALIVDKLNTIAAEFKNLELKIEDFGSDDSAQMIGLVGLIVNKAPGVLSEMSGLNEKDVAQLPVPTAVELFNKCLDVNIDSQESLVKNFKELGAKFQKITQVAETPQREKLPPAH